MKLSFVTFAVVMALVAPTWAAEDFTGTKEVRLIHGDLGSPKAKTVVVTDKAKVDQLVAAIKLEEKEPCACDHIEHAVFVKDKDEITVSLCDHCFDIGKNTYRMPADFYKLYTAYSQTQPTESKKATTEVVVDAHVQGLITVAPDEKGTFAIQPQGTNASADIVKVATNAKTVVAVAQDEIKVTELKVGMWARVELVNGIAAKIVAGHLWLEDGEKLVFFKGLPQEFFTHSAGFDVNNVPTKFGPLRMVYRLTGNGSYLRWGRKALPKEGMVVHWPTSFKARFSYGPPVKSDDQGVIRLPADVSELRIWFVDQVVPQKSALAFDTYGGYFVSNKFEPDAAELFVVINDQEQFDKVFGVAFVMRDTSHRLPKDAFKSLMVVTAIKRGNAFVEYKVESVTEEKGVVELRYTTTEKKSDTATFACPLIVSIPKGEYKAIQFVESKKPVKKLEIEKKP